MQQLIALRKLPLTTAASVERGLLRWAGHLQPTTHSDTYSVCIEYRAPGPPDVTIMDPQLEVGDAFPLPHVFDGDRLCLYYKGQWNSTMLLARTVVPWASEWLLFYELWQIKHQWHGGGHQPHFRGEKLIADQA